MAAARDLHAKVKAACAASAQASHSGPSGSASSLGVTPDGRVVLEARLVALLQAHEQQLLQRAGAGSAAPVAGSGGDAGAAAQSLGRAHEQLMSTVASREEQRVEEGAPVVDPRVEVEQVAARLERTHTVRMVLRSKELCCEPCHLPLIRLCVATAAPRCRWCWRRCWAEAEAAWCTLVRRVNCSCGSASQKVGCTRRQCSPIASGGVRRHVAWAAGGRQDHGV